MKRLISLTLCCILFTGCTSTNWQVSYDQKKVDYEKSYIRNENAEWAQLQEHVESLAKKDRISWEKEQEIYENENYQAINVFNVESKVGSEIVEILKEVIGEELVEVMESVKNTKENVLTEERVIGDYGVVCTNDGKATSIRCIKSNLGVIDPKSKSILEQVISPEFMFKEMYAGKENNMMQIATPMFIRNQMVTSDEAKTSSYYQIFRENDEKIFKVRLVINKLDDALLDHKHIIPLENIVQTIESKQAISIDTIVSNLEQVYEGEKMKQAGKISNIHYKITKYRSQNYRKGELIEVVLKIE